MTTRRYSTDQDREIGSRVASIRAVRGVTQVMLAHALGVSYQQLQKYETGANRISASRLSKISEYLSVPMSDLLTRDFGPDSDIQKIFQTEGAAEMVRLYGDLDPEQRTILIELCRSAARLTQTKTASE